MPRTPVQERELVGLKYFDLLLPLLDQRARSAEHMSMGGMGS